MGQAECENAFEMASLSPPTEPKRRAMQRQREKDTDPEVALRRELHRRGFRYRLQVRPLPIRRTIDLVFPKERVAVEVRGCFWHSCPQHGTSPKANAEWWREKLQRNRARDEDTAARLEAAGWQLVVVWEHEDVREAADRVSEMVLHRRT